MPTILFVCTGNICRSPTAEGVMLQMVDDLGLKDHIIVDSAGLQGYHVGEPPDPRAIEAARTRGYDISGLRARRFGAGEYEQFDLILGMDKGHLRQLKMMAPKRCPAKIGLLGDFVGAKRSKEIIDPYYGPLEGFTRVLEEVIPACEGLLSHVLENDPV